MMIFRNIKVSDSCSWEESEESEDVQLSTDVSRRREELGLSRITVSTTVAKMETVFRRKWGTVLFLFYQGKRGRLAPGVAREKRWTTTADKAGTTSCRIGCKFSRGGSSLSNIYTTSSNWKRRRSWTCSKES